jgi:hypothetical protein
MTHQKMLESNYKWYEKHQKELFQKYPNKFLIIVDEKVKGAFLTLEGAFDFATKEKVIGNCLLQQCLDHIEVLDFH